MQNPDVWQSPRKIQEDVRLYMRRRFESYMELVDRGDIPREVALSAMREEVEYVGEAATD